MISSSAQHHSLHYIDGLMISALSLHTRCGSFLSLKAPSQEEGTNSKSCDTWILATRVEAYGFIVYLETEVVFCECTTHITELSAKN